MTLDQSMTRISGLLILSFVWLVAGQGTSVTVQVGRRAVLRCDTSLIRFPFEATWELSDGTYLSRGVSYTIDRVTMEHGGTYVCRIRNLEDPTKIALSQLQLNVVPADATGGGVIASIRNEAKSAERLVLGGLIFRDCVVNDPTGGSWSYTWTYPDGRVTRSSLLYITGLREVHFGVFKCVATSTDGRRLESSFRVRSPSTQGGGGGIVVKIRRISLANPMILECYAEGGLGGYTFQWLKEGRVVSSTQRLTVNKLDASSGGSYQCVVTGRGAAGAVSRGSLNYNMRVVVKQSETKIALSPPPGPTHVVEVGSNKELHCELDQSQDRQEEARWFVSRDGSRGAMVPLLPPTATIYPTRSVSILVLTNMKESDSGRYECIVVRNGREIRRDASVIVVSDVGLEVYPGTLTYILGTTRNNPEFHCQVDNLPGGAAGLKWTFTPRGSNEERPLPANVQRISRKGIQSTSFLSIRNPTMSNYGYYVCRAPGGYVGRGALIVRGRARSSIRLEVKPGIVVTVNPGETARILCYELTNNRIVPAWTVPGNVAAQVTQETQGRNRILKFSSVRPDQDNTRFTCHYKNEGRITVTIRVNPGCPRGQRRCRNGVCIPENFFCNGRRDCADGSDESRASCAKCEPNEVECLRHNGRDPVKKCVPVHWICDGEDDCGNGFDERNCVRDVGCDKTLFQCSDGRRIPRGFQCDGEEDCSRNDDETGCSVPRIIRPAGGRIIVRRANRGQEVRLECEAIGTGAPKIVWRYNWGFVTARHRIEERCVDPSRDISNLIITSVEVADAGIYTCEALNNQGRAFAEDYVLEVEGR